MAKASVLEFIEQVKQEIAKVSWPDRKEVIAHFVMVLFLVVLTCIFFFVADLVAIKFVEFVLRFR